MAKQAKPLNPRAAEIVERFFVALEFLISVGKLTGLRDFCDKNELNRPKYSALRNRDESTLYKNIDAVALAGMCDLGISAEWLLTGKGKMTK